MLSSVHFRRVGECPSARSPKRRKLRPRLSEALARRGRAVGGTSSVPTFSGRLAETDGLTGLLNRRAIEARAAEAFAEVDREGAPVAVLLFDIDRFKTINDGFGHAAGDAVLNAVAEAARAELQPGDELARVGGEEFAALVSGVTLAEAGALAERLRRAVAGLALAETAGLAVTGSFGVAFRPAGSEMRWEALVAAADRRLYAAKAAGRNRVVSGDAPAARYGGGSEAAA